MANEQAHRCSQDLLQRTCRGIGEVGTVTTNSSRHRRPAEAVERFLRPLLPSRFGLAKGEVFSADGSQSASFDVIIYDTVFQRLFHILVDGRSFPAESIYGSIESKSYLPGPKLEECCRNVASSHR